MTLSPRFDAEHPEQEPKAFRRILLKADIASEDFVTRQEFFHSPDGTRVPMFIVHRKGLHLNGHNTTLLYGYGGASCWCHCRCGVAHQGINFVLCFAHSAPFLWLMHANETLTCSGKLFLFRF